MSNQCVEWSGGPAGDRPAVQAVASWHTCCRGGGTRHEGPTTRLHTGPCLGWACYYRAAHRPVFGLGLLSLIASFRGARVVKSAG